MHPYVKQEWIKALRSGEYKQTWEVLRCGTAYCCLGVLCDLDAKFRGTEFQTEADISLPSEMLERFGLAASEEGDLMDRNDRMMWSFKKIADYIEKNL